MKWSFRQFASQATCGHFEETGNSPGSSSYCCDWVPQGSRRSIFMWHVTNHGGISDVSLRVLQLLAFYPICAEYWYKFNKSGWSGALVWCSWIIARNLFFSVVESFANRRFWTKITTQARVKITQGRKKIPVKGVHDVLFEIFFRNAWRNFSKVLPYTSFVIWTYRSMQETIPFAAHTQLIKLRLTLRHDQNIFPFLCFKL